jgi:hypothetical protein
MKKSIGVLLLLAAVYCGAFAMPKINISNNQSLSLNTTITYALLDANNLKAYFWSSGIFNQNPTLQNAAGLYWPKNSTNTACFTAGLCIAGKINGTLAESMCSYRGEFVPGYLLNHQVQTNSDFKYYKVNKGDGAGNPDYVNWYKMVPYGAPYKDVNNNGVFDPGIDIPGMPNSAQTIFICMTDGFAAEHNSGEGFGGGITSPLLNSEVHLTAWVYDTLYLPDKAFQDVQFMKWEVINKGQYNWDGTFFSFFVDCDLGYGYDDYQGCDTIRHMGFVYNGTNYDNSYGANPPAYGLTILSGGVRKYQLPSADSIKMSSFVNTGSNYPPCEDEVTGLKNSAYFVMSGFKNDGTPFLNPTVQTGTRKTKFVCSGDPETNTGWNAAQGRIPNCGGDTTGDPIADPPQDKKFVMSSGRYNFTVAPDEKQYIIAAQMVARGTSNLNSVTKLKELCTTVRNFYLTQNFIGVQQTGTLVPVDYRLEQNYPNPFNPLTTIKYQIPSAGNVTIEVFDINGKRISVLMDGFKDAGYYSLDFNVTGISSGIYFYRMTSGNFTDSKKMIVVK